MPTPAVHGDEPIPSTSGSNNIVNTNTTFDDDEDFGTQNREHLNSELQVELIESGASSENLPDFNCFNLHSSDIGQEVTTFRALNADEMQQRKKRSRKGKFYKDEDEDDTTFTDSDA